MTVLHGGSPASAASAKPASKSSRVAGIASSLHGRLKPFIDSQNLILEVSELRLQRCHALSSRPPRHIGPTSSILTTPTRTPFTQKQQPAPEAENTEPHIITAHNKPSYLNLALEILAAFKNRGRPFPAADAPESKSTTAACPSLPVQAGLLPSPLPPAPTVPQRPDATLRASCPASMYNVMRAATYAQSYLDPVSLRSCLAFTVSCPPPAAASGAAGISGEAGQQQETDAMRAGNSQSPVLLDFHMRKISRVPVFKQELASSLHSHVLPGSVIWVTEKSGLDQITATAQACLAADGYICLEAAGSEAVTAVLALYELTHLPNMSVPGTRLLAIPELSSDTHPWSSSRYFSLHLLDSESLKKLSAHPHVNLPPKPTSSTALNSPGLHTLPKWSRPGPANPETQHSFTSAPQRPSSAGWQQPLPQDSQKHDTEGSAWNEHHPVLTGDDKPALDLDMEKDAAVPEIRRFVISIENRSIRRNAHEIAKEVQATGQCLVLAETDMDISAALNVMRQAKEMLQSKTKGTLQLLFKVRSYPDMDDSPYFDQFPALFGIAFHVVSCKESELRRHLEITSSSAHTSGHTNSLSGSNPGMPSAPPASLGVSPLFVSSRGVEPTHSQRPSVPIWMHQELDSVEERDCDEHLSNGPGASARLKAAAASALLHQERHEQLATAAVSELLSRGVAVMHTHSSLAATAVIRSMALVTDSLGLLPHCAEAVVLLGPRGAAYGSAPSSKGIPGGEPASRPLFSDGFALPSVASTFTLLMAAGVDIALRKAQRKVLERSHQRVRARSMRSQRQLPSSVAGPKPREKARGGKRDSLGTGFESCATTVQLLEPQDLMSPEDL